MARDIETLSDEEFSNYMQSAIADSNFIEEDIVVGGTDQESEVEAEVVQLEQPEGDTSSQDSDNTDEPNNSDVDDDNIEHVDENLELEDIVQESSTEQTHSKQSNTIDTTPKEPTFKLRADGLDLELNEHELKQLASKGFNYTRNMQDIKQYKQHVSALKEAGLSKEDLNLMIDAYKGNKEALTTLIKKTGVDPLDIDIESSNGYVAPTYGQNEVELEIQEVVEDISRDPEYVTTKHIIGTSWDKDSQMEFVKDPSKIAKLHADVKNGIFDKVLPIMIKKKALDGGRKSDIEYYISAGTEYYESKARDLYRQSITESALQKKQAEITAVKQQEAKRAGVTHTAPKRKAATITAPKPVKRSIEEHLDASLSDAEFSKLMEKVIYKR